MSKKYKGFKGSGKNQSHNHMTKAEQDRLVAAAVRYLWNKIYKAQPTTKYYE